MPENNQMSFLDLLTVLSFFIGIANYSENVSQGTMQEAIQTAVEEIHSHLKEQDEKINWILSILEDEE